MLSLVDLDKLIAELREERDRIDEAIQALEGIGLGQYSPRHAAPLSAANPDGPKRRGRPPGRKNRPKFMLKAAGK